MATKEQRVRAAEIAAAASAKARRSRWGYYGHSAKPKEPAPERVRVELRPEKSSADAWTRAATKAGLPLATWAQKKLNDAARVR